MTRTRLLYAHLVIALVGLGSLACIVLDGEAWPFSNYPMYSEMRGGRREMIWLYGETAEGERPLLDDAYWAPFARMPLSQALTAYDRLPDRRERLHRVIADLARRYEEGRMRGRHGGPAVRVLRAYEVTWMVRSGLDNHDRPDSRRLLAEFSLDAPR